MRLFGAGVGELREIAVEPPSLRDEGAWVFMAAVFVLVCVAYTVAFERFGVAGRSGVAPSTEVLPYQILFRDLPSVQQRVFRAMQEGALEALPRRAAGNAWPAVEALAAEGIPPFAPDVLDKTGMRWTLRRSDLLWQYVGAPSAPDAPAYLISIQEPDAATGEKPVPGVVDEEHQLLPDGRLLHVTYWIGRADARADPILDPALRGWKQVRVTSPFEEMEKQMETLR